MKISAIKLMLTLLAISILTISCNNTQEVDKMENKAIKTRIFPKGQQAPSQIFSNTVFVNMLHTDEDGSFDTQVYDVIFEAGARTHWHSHPGGQILLVTDGVGYYQEKDKEARRLTVGDVVAIPANVVHWHGAAPDSEFTHIGMSTQVHLGPAEWFGPVTDEEYAQVK